MATNTPSDPLAKCLSSIRVDVAAVAGACKVSLTPLAAADNFVNGLWSGASSYTNLVACPATAGTAQIAVGNDDGVPTAILAALNSAIYGTPVAGAGADSIDWTSAGKAVIRRTAGSVTLEFAVTSVSHSSPPSCC